MVTVAEWTKSTFVIGKEIPIDKIFRLAIKHNASDIHLQVNRPPIFRVRGGLTELEMAPIPEEQMIKLTFPMMDQRNLDIFQHDGGADYAKTLEYEGEVWRFRVNLFTQVGMVGLVARKVEQSIPPFEKLCLPPIMEDLCRYDQGMVLLAGVTGSGKSTTIGSMLNWINANMNKHILTIEDPIEFVYTSDQCLINQRELGMDVVDFSVAMKHAVRQDPDIILVGEMRDRETFETAIHAAETGHLVRAGYDRSYSRPVPAEHALGDSRKYGDEHESDRRSETSQDDCRRPSARTDRRSHALQSDGPQADS